MDWKLFCFKFCRFVNVHTMYIVKAFQTTSRRGKRERDGLPHVCMNLNMG